MEYPPGPHVPAFFAFSVAIRAAFCPSALSLPPSNLSAIDHVPANIFANFNISAGGASLPDATAAEVNK